MNHFPLSTLVRCLALAITVLSCGATAQAQDPAAPGAQASATATSEGEVRKIDVEAQKLTLRHGPITNLDMPPMTMVFRVADPDMLRKVQVGDKVRFKADKVGGQITVVQLEVEK